MIGVGFQGVGIRKELCFHMLGRDEDCFTSELVLFDLSRGRVVLQCVVVCCSVLQWICTAVLQCAAVC